MTSHSAMPGADQPSLGGPAALPSGLAAVRAAMAAEERVELPDALVRQEAKRLLWRCWQVLPPADRAAFLHYVNGGEHALHR